MKVLVVGGGAREHALCWKLKQSPILTDLICAPGNPGIAGIARCLPIAADHIDGLVELAVNEHIDLVVVGPEDPLAAGLVDRLQARGIAAFGPNQQAARVEASKSYAKNLMLRCGIPTARYEVITSLDAGLELVRAWPAPLVIKADGLARGRGVAIARTREEAEAILHRYLVDRVFGEPGETVIIEEFLAGEEVSLIGLSDGTRVLALAPAQDHKALLDGDQGPNTGGMGCISPVPGFSPADAAHAGLAILQRAVDAMRSEGTPFRGALFAGLIVTSEGPHVLEFNCRFGDPESEVLFPRMRSDLLPLLFASATSSLDGLSVEWQTESAACVVLTSSGYPGTFEKGKEIHGLDSMKVQEPGSKVQVFHAGTAEAGGKFVTAGGRVLAVTALGDSLGEAIDRAYDAANKISFQGAYRRSDIGQKRKTAAT